MVKEFLTSVLVSTITLFTPVIARADYPYTENVETTPAGYVVTIRQTPSWANLSLEDRKSLRQNMWNDLLNQYPGAKVVANFYTSHGYLMTRYSTYCGGLCFSHE